MLVSTLLLKSRSTLPRIRLFASSLLLNHSVITGSRRRFRTSVTMGDEIERGTADGAECDLVSSATNSVASNAAASNLAANALSQSLAKWEPNADLMAVLTEMGIGTVAAKKALYYTGNSSAEVATAWIFENDGADLDTPLEVEASREAMSDDERQRTRHSRDICKMIFVVNSGLDMGVGKVAAQVAHAALGMHQILLQNEAKFGDSLFNWFEFGETKIVLKGNSTQHLMELEKKAMEVGLPAYLVS